MKQKFETLKNIDLSKVGNDKLKDLIKKNIDQFNPDLATEKGWANIENMIKMVEDKFPEAMLNYKPSKSEKELEREAEAAAKADMKKDKAPAKEKKEKDYHYESSMLGRLVSDCDYFLGNGNKNEKQLQQLNVKDQIKEMKRLWNLLPDNYRGGVTMKQINDYESKMTKTSKVKKESKPEPKAKAKAGDKVGKYTIIDEKDGVQEVADNLKLKKTSDDVYTMINKDKAVFDFVKKSGKWHVECKVDGNKRPSGFNTLNGAVMYVAKTVYSAELRKFIEQKKKAQQAQKEWREKNPEGSPAKRDVEKGVEKATEKIVEKAKDNKDVTSDVKKVFATIKSAVKEFASIADEIDEDTVKEIDALISELQKLKAKIK